MPIKRKLQLDGLRGIAILMVFCYHGLKAPLGWAGVDLFFVLSGYLITGILLRLTSNIDADNPWKVFYLRRARRILPPLALFLIVVTIAFKVHWQHLWFWYVFFDANLSNAFHRTVVWAMIPLWSLAVEEQFYFVWPAVVVLCERRTVKRTAIFILIAAPILRAAFTPFVSRDVIYCLTPFRADTLAWGALVALLEFEDPEWIQKRHRLAGYVVLTAGLLVVVLSKFRSFRLDANSILFNTIGYSLIAMSFAMTIVYVLGPTGHFFGSILTSRPLRYMGTISYTFYLYHLGVLILVRRHFHGTSVSAVLDFIITGGIAALSWKFYESQILRNGSVANAAKQSFYAARSGLDKSPLPRDLQSS